MRALWTALALLAVGACADDQKDYDAMAKCHNRGHEPGSQAYADCVAAEKGAKIMERQRREFEEMKRQQEEWKMRRY